MGLHVLTSRRADRNRRVYKRYLHAEELAAEIGGEPLLDGAWFSAARAISP